MYYAPNMYINAKVKIHLMHGGKISGRITINDSSLLVSNGDTDYKTIRILEIRSIKIKRNAVANGLDLGAVSGGLLGYVVGYITYNGDDSYYPDEDPPEQKERAWAGAMIGAVPGAVAGGIIGGIFTKRHFRIDGDIRKLHKTIETLRRAELLYP